ncbi:hypothetical protein CHUAL_004114 [Chamberlinius hualienensis]
MNNNCPGKHPCRCHQRVNQASCCSWLCQKVNFVCYLTGCCRIPKMAYRERKSGLLDKLGLGKKEKERPTSQFGFPKSHPSTSTISSDLSDQSEENNMPLDIPDSEVDELFEKMLDDMNLTEEKKEPLRKRDINGKKVLLGLQKKGTDKSGSKLVTATDYIQALSELQLSVDKLPNLLVTLRIALTNKPVSWATEFGEKGLNHLLLLLDRCHYKKGDGNEKYEKIQHECVKCLGAFMNNKSGLKLVCSNKKIIQALCKSLDYHVAPTFMEAVNLLACLCLVPPNGYELVLEAITDASEYEGNERFRPIVNGLTINNNIALAGACMKFINALISTPDDLGFRLHLRNEFMRAGLIDLLDKLKICDSEEIQVQLQVFHAKKEEDAEEFSGRYDHLRLELEYPFETFCCNNIS